MASFVFVGTGNNNVITSLSSFVCCIHCTCVVNC